MRRNSDFTKLVQKSLSKQTTTTTKTTTIILGEEGESYLLSGPIVILKILSLQKKIKRQTKAEASIVHTLEEDNRIAPEEVQHLLHTKIR